MIKTIAQIANEIGVSKQAVWQKIKREPLATNLSEFTQKIGNTVYISNDGISIIKNCFLKNKIDETSIDINCHQQNISETSIDINNNKQENNPIKDKSPLYHENTNKTSIDVNINQDKVDDTSIDINKHQHKDKETSIDFENSHEENIDKFEKDSNMDNINIDDNKHQLNKNKTSIDKVVDVLLLQIETLNKQNENLSKELSDERKHSRELADKLAELATNAQKLHAGDIVTPRLNMNEVELNSEENTKKKNSIFRWFLNKSKKE